MAGSLLFPTPGCQLLFSPRWSILEGVNEAKTEHRGQAEFSGAPSTNQQPARSYEYNPIWKSLLMSSSQNGFKQTLNPMAGVLIRGH